MINNITGSPVEGNDFFGREKELEFVWRHIKKGNSIILSAPRRVGKSSLAKRVLKEAKENGWDTLEINLEEVKSEEGFVKKFVEQLTSQSWWTKVVNTSANKIEKILESIKTSIEYEGAKATLEWRSSKSDVYENLKKLLNHEKETLIMVDELTVVLSSFIDNDPEEGKKNAEFFLNWLRSFRQVSGTKIRWIFCSSIGIDNFTNQHNLSYTFNDVDPYPIGAFKREKAKELLLELARSEGIILSEEVIEYKLNKLGWLLPYFIQILFFKFYHLVQVEDREITTKTVDEAYTLLISEKHLNTWEERLNEYNVLEIYARLLLKRLSINKQGESRGMLFTVLNAKINDEEKTESILSKLLYMLQNDGYLIEEELKYAFRSPLLRDFWYNRFSK
ncbi:AAA-like domain-containing protein [Flavobacterium sp.]|uniref:AAA-like domain-containing protein n=1 Tax=Flavobacterium sp. TaxID=239 RepID=UPI00286BDB2D|nr:AAA-like domain-containing protein [Flavobacterium sp.]